MSITAMKQALEALEESHPEAYRHAIASLRQAIEKAEKKEPKKWVEVECPLCGEMAVAHTHPVLTTPQPQQAEKQEPVGVVDSTISGHIDWLCVVFPKQGTKLYTTPQPQREWVGLTDEEIALVCSECAASAHNWNDISFARAIEAKLKEKNT